MQQELAVERFKEIVLPHLKAAYRLARWLTRDHDDAEEVVQEAYLSAFKHFEGYHGGDARAWLLKIVRNTYYTSLRRNRHAGLAEAFDDEEAHPGNEEYGNAMAGDSNTNPESLLLRKADAQLIRQALEQLPAEFREILVLRELEELSYKEIAAIAEIPIGTVMSRLARARHLLWKYLTRTHPELAK